MLDSIELKKFLKRLGANKLSNLVGYERLEAIHETLSSSVTESRMVDILYRRYGASIFEQKEIRRLILSRLFMYSVYPVETRRRQLEGWPTGRQGDRKRH